MSLKFFDLSTKYNKNALNYAIKGESVCRNYSVWTMVLLQDVGITVYEIKRYDHIRNIILLDDEFYWLDLTWLDGLTEEDFHFSALYGGRL